jgi:hypothetical protein
MFCRTMIQTTLLLQPQANAETKSVDCEYHHCDSTLTLFCAPKSVVKSLHLRDRCPTMTESKRKAVAPPPVEPESARSLKRQKLPVSTR